MLLRYNVYTGNDIGKIESTQTQAAKKISGFPCWPFGSYARGDATSNSDIDIAVEITGTTILFRLFEAPIPHQAFS